MHSSLTVGANAKGFPFRSRCFHNFLPRYRGGLMIRLQCLGIYRTLTDLQYKMFVIPVTIVIGKTQFCLSEMQYEAVNISNMYECI